VFRGRVESDCRFMGTIALEWWLAIAVVITFSVGAALYVLASILRDATRRIDLYVEVARLRAEYEQKMQDMRARGFDIPDTFTVGGFELIEAKKAA
jgi:hypothetical protein